MGEIEKYGTGFIRIREWMSEYPHLALSIEDLGDFTRVKIEKLGNVTGNVTGDFTENFTENFTERQIAVLDLINKNPSITTTELSGRLNVTRRTIMSDIDKCKSAGILRRVGPDRGGHWEVVKVSK
jgi:ATP-dependent DNA helicase RecG